MKTPTLTPVQQRQLLLGVLGALAVVAWWLFLLAPQQRALAERGALLRTLRPQVAELRQQLDGLSAVEAEIARLTTEPGLSTHARRPEEQLPDLLQAITQMAQGARVRLVALKPKLDLGGLTPGPSGYLELPVAMQVSAGYHELGQFIDALERSPQLVRVGEFEIGPTPEDLWHHQAVIMLQVYLVPAAA
ncbi:MAG: type 4a pilus biogenesis protein PilO [Candidatus Omnitrophica bacterium]|nr:type 4a pilus biogenesis protein PilO [Candidatus Omnitrophota bacterium]